MDGTAGDRLGKIVVYHIEIIIKKKKKTYLAEAHTIHLH